MNIWLSFRKTPPFLSMTRVPLTNAMNVISSILDKPKIRNIVQRFQILKMKNINAWSKIIFNSILTFVI